MAIKERDVVLMGKDGADGTIDLPVTRLGNIEDGAEVKTGLVDADAVPVVDSADGGEMKKITWANVVEAVKGKLNRVYAAVSHEHTKSEITDFPTSMTPAVHAASHRTGEADALSATDVGADPAGSAADTVSAHDESAQAHKTLLAGKAAKSKQVSATIGTTWSGSAGAWTQTLNITGVTATNVVEVFLTKGATDAQDKAYTALQLRDGGQAAGKITLKAKGTKNTITVPLTVIVRGDL